jgi:hypothetical protein
MLRLIGAVIVVLLIAGPLLAQTGMLDRWGLIQEFVHLETKLFVHLVDAIRRLWAGNG